MKNRLNFAMILLCLVVVSLTVSCKKKKEDPQPSASTNVGNNSNLTVASDQSFHKKWANPAAYRFGVGMMRQAAGAATAGTSDYAWFDFSPYGIFVIMKIDSSIIEGTYTYDAPNNKLILDGFGEIQITTVSSTDFSFTLTPTSGTPETVIANAGTVVDQTSKTLQFARVWKLTKQTQNGTDTGILSLMDSAYVMVSKYGTHMLAMKNFLGSDSYTPQVWKWSDASQANICVGDFVPDCSSTITITLTSANKMVADYKDGADVMHEEYEELIIQ
ncbi:MAG: hypothetical protein ACJ75J_11155 [Cytophagaceae bacterium]